jgi:tRNA-specific 2-thiouridylase
MDGEHGVAAGQACVFYTDGEPRARILGGGFIQRVESVATRLAIPNQSASFGTR